MQDGWFWDDKRNPKDGSSYYLFSADGITSFGPGTLVYTVASNLPELLFTTPEDDPKTIAQVRQSSGLSLEGVRELFHKRLISLKL